MKRAVCIGIIVIGSGLFAYQASATSVLVSQAQGITLGIGYAGWSELTAALNTATDNNVTISTTAFTDYAVMDNYDAIWLDQRGNFLNTLTATEAGNIATYIDSGRRVVMIGSWWWDWNNQFLGIVGGSQTAGTYYSPSSSSNLNPISHELTQFVTSLYFEGGQTGLVTGGAGGTALFDPNFATLWGDESNVLTILNVVMFKNSYWGISSYNNDVFGTNVAEWIAASAPVPEPASIVMLGAGMVGMAAARRVTRRERRS